MVEKMFGNYISKHKSEDPFKSKLGVLSEHEIANRELNTFLKQNNIVSGFNKKQRIILISSEFDAITLSSSAWLIRNGVDLSCYELKPIRINGKHIVEFSRIMPVDKVMLFSLIFMLNLAKRIHLTSQWKKLKDDPCQEWLHFLNGKF